MQPRISRRRKDKSMWLPLRERDGLSDPGEGEPSRRGRRKQGGLERYPCFERRCVSGQSVIVAQRARCCSLLAYRRLRLGHSCWQQTRVHLYR